MAMTKKDSKQLREAGLEIYSMILGMNYAIELNKEYISDLKTEIKDLSKATRASEGKLKKLIARYAELRGIKPEQVRLK